MRPTFVKTAIALIIGASVNLPAAYSADWNGSYSASGQCFCVGDLPRRTIMSIVPTPVGGQTVAQVCRRLGDGPGLSKTNGVFNHPVYADAQCGHGPGVAAQQLENSCPGSIDGVGGNADSCLPAGPQWDLKVAFRPDHALDAAESGNRDTAAVPVYRTSALGLIGKPVSTGRAMPVSGGEEASEAKAPPQGSQWVIIDGNRFLRAREGVPAAGGAPGQRIILDGSVYLLDNGNIKPDELYFESTKDPSDEKEPVKRGEQAASGETDAKNNAAKAAAARQARERKAAALQQREDARATARQIETQRRQLKQEKLAELDSGAPSDEQELQRAKQQLETESASRAQAVLESHAKARLIEQHKLRQVQSAVKSSPGMNPLPDTENLSAEPPIAAASEVVDAEGDEEAVVEATRQARMPGAASDEAALPGEGSSHSSVASALRLPAAVRASARNFRYLEALPVSYDVGGDGVMLEGSTSSHSRLQYFGRLGVTRRYGEIMAGAGYYLTPESASRLTFVLLAGVEYGNFELIDGQSPEISVDYDDSGVYLAASSRMVVNSRFELKAGFGYSSIFEGDSMFFGGGYLHLTRKLDLVTRFELGDNDLLGIGVRYYY